MKRTGVIVCLTIVMVLFAGTFAFGADSTLKLVDTYPVDGQENTTKENMCVKLNFNNEMGAAKDDEIDKSLFSIKDKKGNKVPIMVLLNPDDRKQIMVLADTNKKLDINDDTEYTLSISKDLADANGNSLGENKKISFKTLDQNKSSKIYMLMMLVMFGGMFIFMARATKKHAEADSDDDFAKEIKVNPYKEAKRTGRSVEEIIAEQEKARIKAEKKAAKKAAKAAKEETFYEDEVEELAPGHFKVKRIKTIAEGGGTYITGRKAAAEARKAQEEKWAQQVKKKKRK